MFDVNWKMIKPLHLWRFLSCRKLYSGSHAVPLWALCIHTITFEFKHMGLVSVYSCKGLVCVPFPVYTFPKVAYSQPNHNAYSCFSHSGITSLHRSKMLQAHDRMKNGVCTQPVIAFVESTHLLMVNHHKVNMKMDYVTDQTDHDSFIIICLFFLLSSSQLARLRGESSAVSFFVCSLCHMREYLLEYLCLTDAESFMHAECTVTSKQSPVSVYFQLFNLYVVDSTATVALLSWSVTPQGSEEESQGVSETQRQITNWLLIVFLIPYFD